MGSVVGSVLGSVVGASAMEPDVMEQDCIALQEVQMVANEGVVLAGNAAVVDTEENPRQQTNPPVESKGEVPDLIYAIAIRPHQS